MLGGEQRDGRELHGFLQEQAVPHAERGRVDQAHDVARVGLVDDLAFPAEHLLRVLRGERLSGAGLRDHHAALEHAGADTDEGHVVAVGLVHACLDLEDEAGERGLDGTRAALDVRAGRGRRGEVHQGVQKFLDAEVQRRGAEQDGGGLAGVEAFDVEGEVGLDDQASLVDGIRPVVALAFGRFFGGEVLGEGDARAGVVPLEAREPVVAQVPDAAEVSGDTHGPGQGHGLQPGSLRDLVHEGQCVQARAVPFVDDSDDGEVALFADLEQLHGLRLKALGRVHEHHGAVDGGEHAVGVLGEVGVAGGVQQVDHGVPVGELQGGRADGDAAVLLHLHPVRDRLLAVGLAAGSAGGADHLGVQGEGLGERGLAGVRVGDDSERPAAGGLLMDLVHSGGALHFLGHGATFTAIRGGS